MRQLPLVEAAQNGRAAANKDKRDRLSAWVYCMLMVQPEVLAKASQEREA